jgi:hypothetical protein
MYNKGKERVGAPVGGEHGVCDEICGGYLEGNSERIPHSYIVASRTITQWAAGVANVCDRNHDHECVVCSSRVVNVSQRAPGMSAKDFKEQNVCLNCAKCQSLKAGFMHKFIHFAHTVANVLTRVCSIHHNATSSCDHIW